MTARLGLSLFFLLTSLCTFAQEGKDLMRDNGRINVVVAVMLTILAGLILYITHLDRKLRRVEKELDKKS